MIAPIDVDCPRCEVKAKQPCRNRVPGHPNVVATLDYHHAERVDRAARVGAAATHGRFPGVVTHAQALALAEHEDLAREALKYVATARDLLSGSGASVFVIAQLESALDALRKLIA